MSRSIFQLHPQASRHFNCILLNLHTRSLFKKRKQMQLNPSHHSQNSSSLILSHIDSLKLKAPHLIGGAGSRHQAPPQLSGFLPRLFEPVM